MDHRTVVIRETVTNAEKTVEDAKYEIKWRNGEYKVNKPNIGDQEVVPVSVVLEILNSFRSL